MLNGIILVISKLQRKSVGYLCSFAQQDRGPMQNHFHSQKIKNDSADFESSCFKNCSKAKLCTKLNAHDVIRAMLARSTNIY